MESDELKITMKESCRRDTNPFLPDEENDKVNIWNNQELESSIVEQDFTTNLEDEKLRKSLAPCNVSSESLEKAKELYIDKNVTECDQPELVACYKESGFHVVKDICVDEGLSNGEKIETDKEHHDVSCNPITVNGDKHDDMIEDDLGTDFPTSKQGNDHMNIGYNHDDMIGEVDTWSLKHESMKSSSGEDHYTNSDTETTNDHSQMGKCNDIEIPGQNSSQGKDCVEDATKESTIIQDNGVDQQLSESPEEPGRSSQTVDISNEIKMGENITSDFDNEDPATIPECVDEETQSAPNHQDVASDNVTVANQLQHGGGESSFSAAGPVSGLITFSGPVATSGSISHRSDGSNTSVRSFAFPILQTEWNSSPVRMAKADQSRSPKHRGWRQALMCCRF